MPSAAASSSSAATTACRSSCKRGLRHLSARRCPTLHASKVPDTSSRECRSFVTILRQMAVDTVAEPPRCACSAHASEATSDQSRRVPHLRPLADAGALLPRHRGPNPFLEDSRHRHEEHGVDMSRGLLDGNALPPARRRGAGRAAGHHAEDQLALCIRLQCSARAQRPPRRREVPLNPCRIRSPARDVLSLHRAEPGSSRTRRARRALAVEQLRGDDR